MYEKTTHKVPNKVPIKVPNKVPNKVPIKVPNKHLTTLKTKGLIARVGSNKTGYWEVMKR